MNWVEWMPIAVAVIGGTAGLCGGLWTRMQNGRYRRQLAADLDRLDKMKAMEDTAGFRRLKIHIDRSTQELVALEELWRPSELRLRARGTGLLAVGLLGSFLLLGPLVMSPTLALDVLSRLAAALVVLGLTLRTIASGLRSKRQTSAYNAIFDDEPPLPRLRAQFLDWVRKLFGQSAGNPRPAAGARRQAQIAPKGSDPQVQPTTPVLDLADGSACIPASLPAGAPTASG